jgi:hypothetical protein
VGAEVPDPLPSTAEAIVGSARDAVRVRPAGRRAVAALAVLAAIAIVAGLVVSSSDDRGQLLDPLPHSVVLGSSLPASGIRSVDCSGSAPSGASEPCVVAQTRLGDRIVAARSAGVVRRWAVRGARGELALEVLRRRGSSTYLVARTPYSLIRDEGVHLLSANLPVRAGDLVGLAVAPGAGVGVRRVDGAITRRRVGPTTSLPETSTAKASRRSCCCASSTSPAPRGVRRGG